MQTFGNEGDSAVPSEVFYFWFPPKIFSIFIFWYKQKVQEHAFRTQVRPNCSTHVGPCVLNGSGCNCVRSRVLKLCFQHCSISGIGGILRDVCLFLRKMLDSQGYCRVTIFTPGQTLMNPDIISLLQIKLLMFLSHQDTKI